MSTEEVRTILASFEAQNKTLADQNKTLAEMKDGQEKLSRQHEELVEGQTDAISQVVKLAKQVDRLEKKIDGVPDDPNEPGISPYVRQLREANAKRSKRIEWFVKMFIGAAVLAAASAYCDNRVKELENKIQPTHQQGMP